MTYHSICKTIGTIIFEKPHIDPVTLKPVFRERISFSSKLQLSLDDVNKFLLDLRAVTDEVAEIKLFFITYDDNDEKLRELVKEYEHQH